MSFEREPSAVLLSPDRNHLYVVEGAGPAGAAGWRLAISTTALTVEASLHLRSGASSAIVDVANGRLLLLGSEEIQIVAGTQILACIPTGTTPRISRRTSDGKRLLVAAQGSLQVFDTESFRRTGQVGIKGTPEQVVMDWLLSRQQQIETALAKRHLKEGTLVLYDVTSTYFEGRHCSLARIGHSRDGKLDRPQIVFGLLTDGDGCPVATEVFDGNTGDPKTLRVQIQKLRERFGLKRVVLVGDRGMITGARIEEDLKQARGLEWITALRGPAIQKLVESGVLDVSLFDEKDLAEISSPDYPGKRLIVCRNPLLAVERRRKREDLLLATEKELEKVAAATRRAKSRLKGKDRIGVGRVLGRFKMAKHFRLEIGEDSFRYERDQAGIAEETALDGIYVIRTSVPAQQLSAEDGVACYKRLAQVERAFRSLKTVDLKVRPIHHHLADRVRAHVLVCMLAYYVEWHMRRALAPMLFDDDDRAAAALRRRSAVAKAERSYKAERKARTKLASDGSPVHSFQTLLHDLATLTKNRIQPKDHSTQPFEMITTPTPLQQRAFHLLGVSPRL